MRPLLVGGHEEAGGSCQKGKWRPCLAKSMKGRGARGCAAALPEPAAAAAAVIGLISMSGLQLFTSKNGSWEI